MDFDVLRAEVCYFSRLYRNKQNYTDILRGKCVIFDTIGYSNRDHTTYSKRGSSERFSTLLSKADLDRLLNKALQAPSLGGGCVIPIIVPYIYLIS